MKKVSRGTPSVIHTPRVDQKMAGRYDIRGFYVFPHGLGAAVSASPPRENPPVPSSADRHEKIPLITEVFLFMRENREFL